MNQTVIIMECDRDFDHCSFDFRFRFVLILGECATLAQPYRDQKHPVVRNVRESVLFQWKLRLVMVGEIF